MLFCLSSPLHSLFLHFSVSLTIFHVMPRSLNPPYSAERILSADSCGSRIYMVSSTHHVYFVDLQLNDPVVSLLKLQCGHSHSIVRIACTSNCDNLLLLTQQGSLLQYSLPSVDNCDTILDNVQFLEVGGKGCVALVSDS